MQDEGDTPAPQLIDRLLRVLEGIIFCCLTFVVIFWFADRLRSVQFEPILVSPCEGAACVPYAGPDRGSPWSLFTEMLEPSGVTTFSGDDMCVHLASALQTRGEQGESVDLIIDRMVSRGMVEITEVAVPQTDQRVLSIAAGPRNDSFGDAVRDALSWKPTHGCHAMNYKLVFWPLFSAWIALASLRVLRSRQAVWAAR